AAAGLERDDPLHLDLVAAPAHPHLVGKIQQLVHPLIRKPQRLQRLVFTQTDAVLEHLTTGGRENVHGSPYGFAAATKPAASNVPPNRGASAARAHLRKSLIAAMPA